MAPLTPALPNRAFGGLVVVALIILGIADWWREGRIAAWLLVLALVVLLPTVLRPSLLAPATRAWLALGAWLHRIVSPITLGVLYFGMITPLALVLRLGRRDVLERRFEPGADTYWIERDPPGPDIAGLPRQF